MTTPTGLQYSVVIPFYNEAEVAKAVIDEVCQVLTLTNEPFEVLAVDDGSTDSTGGELEQAAGRWSQCRVIHHPQNAGQAAALLRGFSEARGSTIITLDGDGQNVPADIPQLLSLLADGDMVVGIRTNRSDSGLRRSMSRVANKVRGCMLGDGLADGGCALKVFRREVAQSFWPIQSLYSFMPSFAVNAGYRVLEAPVRDRHRVAGRSNYGLRVMLWRPLLDMLALWWLLRVRRVVLTRLGR